MVTLLARGLMLCVLLAAQVNQGNQSVVLLCLYVAGIGMFLGNQHAFKQDVAPGHVGTIAALVGFIETGFTYFVLRKTSALIAVDQNYF